MNLLGFSEFSKFLIIKQLLVSIGKNFPWKREAWTPSGESAWRVCDIEYQLQCVVVHLDLLVQTLQVWSYCTGASTIGRHSTWVVSLLAPPLLRTLTNGHWVSYITVVVVVVSSHALINQMCQCELLGFLYLRIGWDWLKPQASFTLLLKGVTCHLWAFRNVLVRLCILFCCEVLWYCNIKEDAVGDTERTTNDRNSIMFAGDPGIVDSIMHHFQSFRDVHGSYVADTVGQKSQFLRLAVTPVPCSRTNTFRNAWCRMAYLKTNYVPEVEKG